MLNKCEKLDPALPRPCCRRRSASCLPRRCGMVMTSGADMRKTDVGGPFIMGERARCCNPAGSGSMLAALPRQRTRRARPSTIQLKLYLIIARMRVNQIVQRDGDSLAQPSAFADASDGMLAVDARLNQWSCASVPTAMATMNTITGTDSVARLAIAGPGHKPTRPQPTPNRIEPATSRRSMIDCAGHWLFSAKIGAPRRASA